MIGKGEACRQHGVEWVRHRRRRGIPQDRNRRSCPPAQLDCRPGLEDAQESNQESERCWPGEIVRQRRTSRYGWLNLQYRYVANEIMRIFIPADMIRKTATGWSHVSDMLAIAIPSDNGAGIRFRMIVNVKNIGDGLGKQAYSLGYCCLPPICH